MADDGDDEATGLSAPSASPIDKLGDALEKLAATFGSHPGFMWTGSGFEVLHADWPAYPRGHGLRPLLEVLGEYPMGTAFFPIDNIDLCTLFVVGRRPERNQYATTHLHVAFWDDDLRKAARAHYVEGVEEDDGYLYFRDKRMTIGPAARHAVLVLELTASVPDTILARVWDHLEAERYDTAVREAALLLEIRMREAVQSKLFGQQLVDQCFGPSGVLLSPGVPNAHRLNLHAAFRTFFAYVRNEYAHNIPASDLITSCRQIRRSGRLFQLVEDLERIKRGGV